jgi:hypothetical protein
MDNVCNANSTKTWDDLTCSRRVTSSGLLSSANDNTTIYEKHTLAIGPKRDSQNQKRSHNLEGGES